LKTRGETFKISRLFRESPLVFCENRRVVFQFSGVSVGLSRRSEKAKKESDATGEDRAKGRAVKCGKQMSALQNFSPLGQAHSVLKKAACCFSEICEEMISSARR
jgi:hypothetical protein